MVAVAISVSPGWARSDKSANVRATRNIRLELGAKTPPPQLNNKAK
jgi:hypothetical protein